MNFFTISMTCVCDQGSAEGHNIFGLGLNQFTFLVIGGSKGKGAGRPRTEDTAPHPHPPGHPNSLDFMQFWGKLGKIVCWRPPPPPGELTPRPRGNLASATACT